MFRIIKNMFKKKMRNKVITFLSEEFYDNPDMLFILLDVSKDLIKHHINDQIFLDKIEEFIKYSLDNNIFNKQVEKLIIEIGMKHGILDLSMDDCPVSNLKIYCYFILLYRHVYSLSPYPFKSIFVTDDFDFLEISDKLEDDYNVRPISIEDSYKGITK